MLAFLFKVLIVIFIVGTALGWIANEIGEWRLMFAKEKRKHKIATWQEDPDVVTDSYTFDKHK